MQKISDTVIELRIATRRACMCEHAVNKKNTLSLRTKVLYLAQKQLSPKDIMLILSIGKTNLAQVTTALIKDGLLVKSRAYSDKREVRYAVTGKGKKYLSECRAEIENKFKNAYSDEESYVVALKKMQEALEIFEYINI